MADRIIRQIADAGLSHLHTLSELHDAADIDSFGDFLPLVNAVETDEQLIAFFALKNATLEILAERIAA
jgi:hypothetical protein